ncbi:hypothetical protein KY337_03805 [Candidatus Woesearchaeota archaeon]|nr:hypothetical protein [Candidatus Woesearchaeota archaeon]
MKKTKKEEFESALLIAFSIFVVILLGTVVVSEKQDATGISGHAVEEVSINKAQTSCTTPEYSIVVLTIVLSGIFLYVLNRKHKQNREVKVIAPLLVIVLALYCYLFLFTQCSGFLRLLIIAIATFLAVITFVYYSIFRDEQKRKKVLRGRK